MEWRQVMRTGAGRYQQGTGVMGQIGAELMRLGHKGVCVIHGRRAFQAAGAALVESLSSAGVDYALREYGGFCTAEDVDLFAAWVRREAYSCLMGVGGGKILDLAKAVAALAGLPVFTVPTVASNCAAFAPLSVIYTREGCQDHIQYHMDSVGGVFVDLDILAKAPPRYLSAGIADAFAKACEYSNMLNDPGYDQLDFGRFIGYRLARESDRILLRTAREALADQRKGVAGAALNDAVSCLIAVTGVVSGFGAYAARGNSRFAIAHGFNEIIRGQYVPDPTRWLHGELVGVGILAQLHANGVPQAEIGEMRSLFRDLSLPTSLSELGMVYGDEGIEGFIGHLLRHCRVEELCHERVREAVRSVA